MCFRVRGGGGRGVNTGFDPRSERCGRYFATIYARGSQIFPNQRYSCVSNDAQSRSPN